MNETIQTTVAPQGDFSRRAAETSSARRTRQMDALCAAAARAAGGLVTAERIVVFEAVARFSSDERVAAQADYAAFALSEADRAEREVCARLAAAASRTAPGPNGRS